jgi:hypothetical protein
MVSVAKMIRANAILDGRMQPVLLAMQSNFAIIMGIVSFHPLVEIGLVPAIKDGLNLIVRIVNQAYYAGNGINEIERVNEPIVQRSWRLPAYGSLQMLLWLWW